MCIRAQGLNGGSSDPTSPRRKASLFNLPPIERSGVFSFKGLVARGLVAGDWLPGPAEALVPRSRSIESIRTPARETATGDAFPFNKSSSIFTL